MELCEVSNTIDFYIDFCMGTWYYRWQMMKEKFRSDVFDLKGHVGEKDGNQKEDREGECVRE